ncbi:MAG: hypothetical protein IJ741_09825 [Schwartzia sp.]|nr:hypothetical protein [Schwartzia sp. (in: firmicutes)]
MDRRGSGMAGLLAALFLISVMAAVAVPRLSGMANAMRMDGEAARLASELVRFREMIMTRQPPHQDFAGATSEVEPEFDLSKDGYRIMKSKMEALGPRHLFPEGMTISWSGGASGKVKFTLAGNAQPVTIFLRSGGEVRYVIIDRVGRVRVSLTPP